MTLDEAVRLLRMDAKSSATAAVACGERWAATVAYATATPLKEFVDMECLKQREALHHAFAEAAGLVLGELERLQAKAAGQ